jgi:CRP/FNR family transcriptional regulator, cyclic AMP receptor protein
MPRTQERLGPTGRRPQIYMAKKRSKTLPGRLTKAVHSRVPLKNQRAFDPAEFLATSGMGRTIVHLANKQKAFAQGDSAENLFYIQSGRIRLSVLATTGKEATIALLGPGDFCGEECIAAGHTVRVATASAIAPCILLKIDREEMIRVLHQEHAISDIFVSHLLARNARVQEDLVDQLFNSSEKRLARILLLLAQFGKERTPETVIPKISQGVLAEMVGTTRARVNFFMNRFRKLGFIEYNGAIEVHPSLLSVVLHD